MDSKELSIAAKLLVEWETLNEYYLLMTTNPAFIGTAQEKEYASYHSLLSVVIRRTKESFNL